MNKSEIRENSKRLRKQLDITKYSNKLTAEIRKTEIYQASHNILLYYPLKYEINFLDLLKDDKNFYFPKVQDSEMLVCPYFKGDKLEKSSMGIYEPCTRPSSPSILNLAIVPALSADIYGNRVGYGGGFYDRFLSKNKHIKTICAIPKCLISEKIPVEEFDIQIDKIIFA